MRLLFRLILIFFAIVAVLSIVRGFLAPSTPARRARTQRPQSAGRLVKDPVCGTYIPEETALRSGNEFFCSEQCRQRFLAS